MKPMAVKWMMLCSGVAVLLAGCSGEPENAGEPSAAEIRGAPIQKLAQTETGSGAMTELPSGAGDAVDAPSSEAVNLPTAEEVGVEPVAESSSIALAGSTESVNAAIPQAAEVFQSDGRDYLSVGFDRLASYEFEVSDELLEAEESSEELTEKTNNLIPESIRDLNKASVAVKGYMLPLKVEQGQVTEFLLMRDQSMCCFGTVPKINEWVSVKTIGSGVKPVMDEPVTIFGKLHVGEIRENGYLVGIYRMDGEKLAGPLDL